MGARQHGSGGVDGTAGASTGGGRAARRGMREPAAACGAVMHSCSPGIFCAASCGARAGTAAQRPPRPARRRKTAARRPCRPWLRAGATGQRSAGMVGGRPTGGGATERLISAQVLFQRSPAFQPLCSGTRAAPRSPRPTSLFTLVAASALNSSSSAWHAALSASASDASSSAARACSVRHAATRPSPGCTRRQCSWMAALQGPVGAGAGRGGGGAGRVCRPAGRQRCGGPGRYPRHGTARWACP